MAMERVRVGDPDRVTLIVARREDPSVLLTYSEERVLSSLHQTEETTTSSVAADLKMPLADVMKLLISLRDKGLVRETGQSRKGVHYSLTEAGAVMFNTVPMQRRLGQFPWPSGLTEYARFCRTWQSMGQHGYATSGRLCTSHTTRPTP